MSVIDIETTVIECLRSDQSKRFDTRHSGEGDGSVTNYEIPLRFCDYMYVHSIVKAMNSVIGPYIIGLFIGVTPCRLQNVLL